MADGRMPRRKATEAGQNGTDANMPAASTPAAARADLPLDDQAWQLHLRGYSYRAIAQRLGIDKDTANAYVKRLAKETAPARKEKRQEWLRQAVDRLQNVQAHAWAYFDAWHDISALNTITAAEREIARLRGLYDAPDDGDTAGGVTITISRRGAIAVNATTTTGSSGNGGAGDE